tara:strand:+ start:197 stop:547 length:351 start_codon:yes stop_codon:yes gene_type:complete
MSPKMQTPEMIELLNKYDNISESKTLCVKHQQYEKATIARTEERNIAMEIVNNYNGEKNSTEYSPPYWKEFIKIIKKEFDIDINEHGKESKENLREMVKLISRENHINEILKDINK